MKAELFNPSLLGLVRPDRLISYATSKGWRRAEGVLDNIELLKRPDEEDVFDQLIVPSNIALADYAERIFDVIELMAQREKRTAASVLADVLPPPSDLLRFRLDGPSTLDGSVPLVDGLELLKGAQRSIRAAACSVLQPQPYHPRLSRSESDMLINGARLGQTERGSFIALLILPLDSVPDDPATAAQGQLFEEDRPDPFVRRASSHLLEAVDYLNRAIIERETDRIFQPNDAGLQVSSNLCEALVEMRPPTAEGSLTINASWAPSVPVRRAIPRAVEIRSEYFPEIERCAAALRPNLEPVAERFFATVTALKGKPNDHGQMEGDVELQFQYDDELLKAKMTLEPRTHQIAIEAYKSHSYVSVRGTLVRKSRIHEIRDCTEFQHLVGGA